MLVRTAFLGVFLTVGCSHAAYEVTSDPWSGGVPFLPIESVDVTKMTYEQNWIELRVDGVFRRAASQVAPGAAASPGAQGVGAIDVNTATEEELKKVRGIGELAKKVIANRPYAQLSDLAAKHVLSEPALRKIAEHLKVGNAGTMRNLGAPKDTLTRTVVAYTGDLLTVPGGENVVRDIYTKFMAEHDDGEKSWNVSGGAILDHIVATTLSLSEPAVLSGASLAGRSMVAIERTRTQVPAAEVRYFNIRVPIGGTVAGEIDLASNGTMTKASSSVQDQFPGAIVTATGSVAGAALGSTALNTLAAHFLAPAQAPAPQAVGTPSVQKVDLSLTRVKRVYTVTVVRPSDTPETACEDFDLLVYPIKLKAPKPGQPIPECYCRATIAVQTKRGDDTDTQKGAKDADDAIKITGSIALPKAKVESEKAKERTGQ